MKAGTTALYSYLARHPLVIPAALKEVHFFDLNFHRGASWYQRHFPLQHQTEDRANHWRHPLITGEATPYYLFHPRAPARVAQLLPKVKIIVLLRDPVSRAYSHYQHEVRNGREPLTFEEAIMREPDRLVGEHERLLRDDHYVSFNHRHFSFAARGRYLEQLVPWFEHFSRDQILVVASEQMSSAPHVVFQRVLHFLEIPDWNPETFTRTYEARYEPMHRDVEDLLQRSFTEPNQHLFDYLQMNFSWSNKTLQPMSP